MVDLLLRNIGRQYDAADSALSSIDLRIPFGETVAIVGPSGSGKSTLLGILGLLDHPTSGRYEIGGVNTDEFKESARSEVRARTFGFVFQAFRLVSYLTVLENVEVGLMLKGIVGSGRRGSALSAISAVGLDHKTSARAGELSGGEQQRVAVARALARVPAVLLCDEPTGNLDSVSSEQVLEAILPNAATATRTTIIVTHSSDIASRCDRILRLADGKLIDDSRASES